MNRRDLIKNAVLSAGALGTGAVAAQQEQQRAATESRQQQFKDRGMPPPPDGNGGAPTPNILWVCTDQQRFDTIQGLSNSLISTPNLQRFLKEAVTFTNVFVQTPICSPSRGSFLTGRYPHSTGLRANGQYIRSSELLVPRILAENSYTCGLAGKLHLAPCFGGRLETEERIDDGYKLFEWSHDISNTWPHAVLISATKLFARQTVTSGVDVRMHRINFFNVSNSAGTYSFAIAQTQGPVPTTATGGNAYASFLLGFGSSGSFPIGSGNALQDFYGAVYVQDDIRLTQRLTVNLGVRYDGESPYTDRHDQLNYFDPKVVSPTRNASLPNLTGGLVFAGTGSTGRTLYSRQHGNVAPRVGFAFSPQSTTSVRGGFGISYAPLEISSNAVGFVPSLGFSSSTAWNTSNGNGVTPANLLRDPFPQGFAAPTGNSLGAGAQLGQSISVWNHNPPTPYSMQWNLDVQQQFPAAVLLDIGYSGSRGEHLTAIFDRNTLDPQYMSLGSGLNTAVSNPFQPFVQIGTLSNATVARRQLLLPYPQFLGVTEVNNPWGDSNYHSLQAKLVKRMSGGLSLLASYTWSKLISNVNSESDQPQNLVLNAVYELPFGHGKEWLSDAPAFADKLLGGWKLTSILTEESGFPLTLTAAGFGGGTRPNLVPGVTPQIPGKRSNQQRVHAWFNTAAFVTPPSYTFGTVGLTGVRGPGISNLDSSLEKFTKCEGLNTEFRVEMFNVTNTPHFAMPDTAGQDAAFGTNQQHSAIAATAGDAVCFEDQLLSSRRWAV